jgi:hypothetical protein
MKMWRTGVVVLISSVRFVFAHDEKGLLEPAELKLKEGSTESRAKWEKVHRPAILTRMEEVMGPLPQLDRKRGLNFKVEEKVDCGEWVRWLITYEPEPNSTTPAYLLIPKKVLDGNERTHGILCLHQTRAEGHKVVVGLADSPTDAYAVELAKRGYVCIAPPYPLLANYAPDLKALGYQSGTMKAIWDNMRALDLLETLPYVRRGSFGSIGHSLGGHNGLYTAVFDERIKVVATSCGFDAYRDYKGGNIRGWTSERYMPRLLNYTAESRPFDFHEVLAAIAPRTIFVNAPIGDSNFSWKSVDRVVEGAMPVFKMYKADRNITVEHPDEGHVFSDAMRERAYEVIEKVLPPK